MSLIKRILFLLILILHANAAFALINPKEFSADKKNLSPEELERLKSAVNHSPIPEERQYYERRFNKAKEMSFEDGIVPLSFMKPYVEPRVCNNPNGQLIVRRSLSEVSLLDCNALKTPDGGSRYNVLTSGAAISFRKDFVADTEEFALEGAVGVGFGYKEITMGDGLLSERGFLAFIEADADRKADGTKPGTVRLGVKGDFLLESPSFVPSFLGISSYYLTDLNFDAEGYGLDIAFTAFNPRLRLNAAPRGSGGSFYYFVARPSIKALSVKDAGETGLTSDTDYLWVGADIGLQSLIFDNNSGGIKFEAGARAFKDTLSSDTAVQRYAAVDFYLNPKRTVAIQVQYEDGRTPSNFNDRETLNIGLGLAF